MSSDNESSILPIPDNSPMPNEILASDSLNGTSQILEEAIGKFVKLCLHSSYNVHNFFQFDNFFEKKKSKGQFCEKIVKLCRSKLNRIYLSDLFIDLI